MKIHYATSVFKYLKTFPTYSLLMLFLSISSYAQVSGAIFKDFNANGTKENTATYNEVGMAGVIVKATNPAGIALTVAYAGGGTSTNTTGNYTVTGGTAGQIRLEFVMPDSYTFASSGASGGTTVMFPSGATQNLAVNYPQDYSQANPQLVVPCYVGQEITGPNAPFATEAAMARFNYYGNSGEIDKPGYTGPPTKVTDHQHLGGTYGVAYNRITKKVFAGAVLHRHVAYGPLGIGGIYEIDPLTGTVNNWLDIESLGIDAGTDTRDGTKLNSLKTEKNYDYASFALVGKTSLGDVEISDDGKVLYVINVFKQSLVAINANTKALIGSYSIPVPAGLNCPPDDFRPWGLKYYKGKLYVGAVCTAQTSKLPADLKAYVLQFDPANPGAGFSTYFSFPLNYTREQDDWHPWHQTAFEPGEGSEPQRNSQPIFSNIEFDVDGSLIMGFLDRHVMMFSSGNYPPDPDSTSTGSATPYPNGDILRACMTSTGLVLEGGAGCSYNPPAAGSSAEYYDDRRNASMKETAGGSLALLAGSGEVVGTSIDELGADENGMSWWNNTNGLRNRAYMIIKKKSDEGGQGKTSGLGDIELLSDAAPIEIGNRVWDDTDADGVQDAGEPALSGVTVTLCDAAGTPIPGATATTDGNGNYYFSTATGTNTPSAIYGLNLSFGTNYILKFPTTNGAKSLSTKDLGGNDLVDSDAGTDGKIAFTTGYAGENNHSFDVGYSVSTCTKPTVGTAVATQATCTGSTANSDAKIDVTGIAGGDKYSYGTDSTTFTYASATAFTGAAINITALANPAAATTYYIRVYNAANDCFKTVSVVLNPKSCTVVCTKPTVGTAVATQATCTGSTVNSDAKIDVTGIAGGDKYSYGTDSTTFTYASATAFTGAAINITALANPAVATTYYIRVYNAANDCFKTVSVVLNPKSCTVVCTKPNAGTDQSPFCSGNTAITTATLAATAVSGGAWTQAGTNPAGASVTNPNSATSGVTGLTPGVYKFIWATSVTCRDTVKIVIPNCQTSPPCTPDVFAYWNFEDCSPGSNTPNDGMTAAITNLSGCSALTVSKLTRVASGNSCQTRENGSTAVCMGSSTNLTFEDNSDKAIMFSLTYPAGSTGKLSSISFESMVPKFVDFNNSGDTTNINNYPTRWGIRVLKNNVEIFRLIDQPLSLNSFTVNNLDWSTNPNFDISGATTFKFEILGYLPSNVAGAGIREIWDLDEVKVYGYCGNCTCTKPNAGLDAAVCQPINTAKLTAVTAGGTWAPIGSPANPSVATIDANGNITGMTIAGTYKFVYSVSAGVQTCTDTAQVTVNAKPSAGADFVGAKAICTTVGTATLTGTPSGGTWAQLGNTPSVAIISNAGAVSAMTSVGTYQFIYTLNGCVDTVAVETRNCNKGSIGDFVWKDVNNNGIQDETTPNAGGVTGVQIELYKNGTFFAKDTTDATGHYLFSNLDAGTYKIKVLSASLPAGCEISSVKDAPSDDAKDSDVDKTTGESGDYIIDPTDPTKKDILTVDAALVIPCVKSKITLTASPVCSAGVQTYSLTFSVTNKVGTVKVDKGTLSGSNPYTVTGIPSGATVKIIDSLSAVCKWDTLITGPNCNCTPPSPTLVTPSLTACIGDTFPTMKATVVGLANVEWFATATSTTVLFTGSNYKPAGTVTAPGAMFYAQAHSTDPTCPTAISTSRVPVTVNAQNCTVEVDLALKKYINKKIAQIGDELTYTLKVFNQSNTGATGVEVTDSIATTVQFVTGSFTASRGNATITGNVIKWTIGNIAAAGVPANGDTVTLTYKVKATQEGVHFNTAEISKTNEKDIDSTPGNGKEGEDDIDHQCFTVPIKLCPDEKVQVNVPALLTNVQWFKNGGTTPVASGNTVLLTEVGSYRFTATNQTCPVDGCCPVIIEPGVNCCPEDLCIPFTIKKRKK